MKELWWKGRKSYHLNILNKKRFKSRSMINYFFFEMDELLRFCSRISSALKNFISCCCWCCYWLKVLCSQGFIDGRHDNISEWQSQYSVCTVRTEVLYFSYNFSQESKICAASAILLSALQYFMWIAGCVCNQVSPCQSHSILTEEILQDD